MNKQDRDLANNRRAYFDYEILETLEAGIVLKGTEIKSLRQNGASLQESYVQFLKGDLCLIAAHIATYDFGNIHNHEERRDRKLLLHKKELKKLQKAVQEKGMTLVALAIYLKSGKAKLKIGLAKGRKKVDKRAYIKEKEQKHQIRQYQDS